MSEETKYELAKELGFSHKVKDGDWGNITTREAGSLVRSAIKKAEDAMAQQEEQ
ncbi:small acid-soluble spore protein F (minor alpha/beta-type SASP) [Candidatus Frackibacter sp. WG12]|nr:small acid-soluble spore protein F (minor alpha/beta-type SASP) [Candidatus Frackibacter sp. WG11]SEN02881.1 small acid-soluble spore protein F (minor alpha/beta-type SASP) [Candidatus Frackibacter sp. WG12]SFM11471.1 small acid-soluble spore protein F (minor alpha/beta-type SASP) [Candidatus Frackibacter sp. WG13]